MEELCGAKCEPKEWCSKYNDDPAACINAYAELGTGGSYGWCAASSSPSALGATTGAAGAGLGCPRLQPFRLEDDDVSMSSAAGWGRRALLRDRMLGAY